MINRMTTYILNYNTLDNIFTEIGNVKCVLYYTFDTTITGVEHKHYIELNTITYYTKIRPNRSSKRYYRIKCDDYVMLANIFGRNEFYMGDVKTELRKRKLKRIV